MRLQCLPRYSHIFKNNGICLNFKLFIDPRSHFTLKYSAERFVGYGESYVSIINIPFTNLIGLLFLSYEMPAPFSYCAKCLKTNMIGVGWGVKRVELMWINVPLLHDHFYSSDKVII